MRWYPYAARASARRRALLPTAWIESETSVGGIGRSHDEAPEHLPHRNKNGVIPVVIPADVH
jgi:hypothetical protein